MKDWQCGHCGAAYREPDPPVGPAAVSPTGSVIQFKSTERAALYVAKNPMYTLVPDPNDP